MCEIVAFPASRRPKPSSPLAGVLLSLPVKVKPRPIRELLIEHVLDCCEDLIAGAFQDQFTFPAIDTLVDDLGWADEAKEVPFQ